MRDFRIGTERLQLNGGSVLFALRSEFLSGLIINSMTGLIDDLNILLHCQEFYEVEEMRAGTLGISDSLRDSIGCYMCGATKFKNSFLYTPYRMPNGVLFAAMSYREESRSLLIAGTHLKGVLQTMRFL